MDTSGSSDRKSVAQQPQDVPGHTAQLLAMLPDRIDTAGPRPTSDVGVLLRDIALHEAGPIMPAHVTGDVLAFVLDTLRTPVLLVDRHLHIVFANTAANAALANNGILQRCGQQLKVTLDAERARPFADAIGAASRGCPIQRTLILDGEQGSSVGSSVGPSVAIWLRPVDGTLQTSASLWSRGLVCVSFRILGREPAISQALLIKHYRLTPKQAEVACRVALGASISAVAADMKIEITTLRSHLSKVFHKTGTRQQAELVSLMLSLTSPVQE